jgi:hypothetical protein
MNKLHFLIALLFSTYAIGIKAQDTRNLEKEKSLVFLMEEEKMARDVYSNLGVLRNYQDFKDISEEEEQHLQLIIDMAKQNEILLPEIVELDFKGKFQNVRLQNLYDELIKKAKTSLVDALEVGAWIEERDIADLELAMQNTVDENFDELYSKLKRDSENHLRTFDKALRKKGVKYAPQILPERQFLDIIDGHNGVEKCSKNPQKTCCKGRKSKG